MSGTHPGGAPSGYVGESIEAGEKSQEALSLKEYRSTVESGQFRENLNQLAVGSIFTVNHTIDKAFGEDADSSALKEAFQSQITRLAEYAIDSQEDRGESMTALTFIEGMNKLSDLTVDDLNAQIDDTGWEVWKDYDLDGPNLDEFVQAAVLGGITARGGVAVETIKGGIEAGDERREKSAEADRQMQEEVARRDEEERIAFEENVAQPSGPDNRTAEEKIVDVERNLKDIKRATASRARFDGNITDLLRRSGAV